MCISLYKVIHLFYTNFKNYNELINDNASYYIYYFHNTISPEFLNTSNERKKNKNVFTVYLLLLIFLLTVNSVLKRITADGIPTGVKQ